MKERREKFGAPLVGQSFSNVFEGWFPPAGQWLIPPRPPHKIENADRGGGKRRSVAVTHTREGEPAGQAMFDFSLCPHQHYVDHRESGERLALWQCPTQDELKPRFLGVK